MLDVFHLLFHLIIAVFLILSLKYVKKLRLRDAESLLKGSQLASSEVGPP